MKKVLFVINTLGRAGAERTLMALLNEFDKEKYEVSLLSIIPRGECFDEIPEGVKILNKKYSSASVMSGSGLFAVGLIVVKSFGLSLLKLLRLPQILRYMTLHVKNRRRSMSKIFWLPLSLATPKIHEEYDLAVAFLEGAATYYVAEKVKARQKAAFIHIDYQKSGYLKNIDRRYYKKFDKIFCVSDSAKEVAMREFPEFLYKLDTFQNVISDSFVKKMSACGKGFDDDFDGIRLLTVGRLHEQKGYKTAIKAFRKMFITEDLNVKWYVVGEGRERADLVKLIHECDLDDKFILLGAKSNTYPYIVNCDIYVHCANYEGWCLAIAEAKILERPIIITESTNGHKQLPPGTFKMVQNNEDEIAAAICEMVTNPLLRAQISEESKKPWVRPNDIPKLYSMMGD